MIYHRRNLPHYYPTGQPIFLTWCLEGSFPNGRHFPASGTGGQAFVEMDRLLDNARVGPLYLRQPDIAQMVVEAIRYREVRGEYELHNYVVMANHVLILITPTADVSKIMQSLKRVTAREGNRMLALTGQPFWQHESYDRVVRGADEFRKIASHIEMNPVNAGLVASPLDFGWSSAGADSQSAANCRLAAQLRDA